MLSGGLVRSQSLGGYHPSLLSGIQLSGVEAVRTWGEDGRLFSSEIQTLDLRGAEFVMLASCETALGEKATGEGLVGIQRSFQIAGARTVIAASWRVQVLATTEIMERFYDNLLNKRLDKLQALREAQIWMLREHGYADVLTLKDKGVAFAPSAGRPLPPYFWAGFVLSGDWTGRIGGSVER
jgi:CHAT domain-containing protein